MQKSFWVSRQCFTMGVNLGLLWVVEFSVVIKNEQPTEAFAASLFLFCLLWSSFEIWHFAQWCSFEQSFNEDGVVGIMDEAEFLLDDFVFLCCLQMFVLMSCIIEVQCDGVPPAKHGIVQSIEVWVVALLFDVCSVLYQQLHYFVVVIVDGSPERDRPILVAIVDSHSVFQQQLGHLFLLVPAGRVQQRPP